MKNAMIKMGILAALLFTAACAGSGSDDADQSVDADGNCTTAFITDYNAALFELERVGRGYGDVQTAKNACAKLTSNHDGDVTCKAEVDYQTQTINIADLIKVCNLL